MKQEHTPLLLLIPFLPLLFLSGCASNVEKVDYNITREIPEEADPAPIMFRGAEFLIPPGQDIGFESNSSRGCGWPRSPVSRTALSRAIDTKFLKQSFHDTLESSGYDVVDSIRLTPEEATDDYLRAEYTINAKIREAQVDLCHKERNNFLLFFSPRNGTDGELALTIDWSVYDPIRRTVVYRTTSEGYTKRRTPNQEGLTLMLHEAFEMAAHNLGTDEQFYNLIVKGQKPNDWDKPGFKKKNITSLSSPFNPDSKVTISQSGLSNEPFTTNIERKRKNAVVVHKIGHGSGFFITKQGHILTNAHVIGDSARTGIVLANKKKRLPVQVLRIDKARDVALLKLEEIPEDYEIITAPIRTQIPKVGEDVYVIGAPLHYSKMQDTLTKGVISAYRPQFTSNLLQQSYIQSDVEIHGGNSGGPMYDANGNIIAMTVASYGAQDSTSNGLNLFIPIGEALDKLGITLETDE